MYIHKSKAFTLVELIVVIIILALLGTIAFISLQGYSKDARDSTRISDLSSMKTSLEVFQLDAGKYPIPTSGTAITYSGATVWTQGTFGETVYSNVSSLDKIPTDSLTDANYTYSTTQSRGEYQLGGILEGDQIVNSEKLIVNSTLAAGTVEAIAIVTGTYNGQVTKSLSGTTDCNILAVPSIITNDTTITDLETINNENRFVYTGKNNLPSSFKSTKFNNEGGFDFQVNKLVAYSDTGSCADLTSKTSFTARLDMLKGIQDAYSGTTLKNEGEIKNILDLTIDTGNPSQAVKNYAGNFVNNNLGGNLSISVSSIGDTEILTGWRALDPNCDIEDIPIGTQIWAGCNSTLGNGLEFGQIDENIGTSSFSGIIANCYDYSGNNTATCTKGDIAMLSNTKANSWFSGVNSKGDSEYDTIWGKLYTWSGTTMGETDISGNTIQPDDNSICPAGRHVPSDKEWEILEEYLYDQLHISTAPNNCRTTNNYECDGLGWDSVNGTKSRSIANNLKIPLAGRRLTDSITYSFRGLNTNFWSSTPSGTTAYRRFFSWSSSFAYRDNLSKTYGFSVRCIKD